MNADLPRRAGARRVDTDFTNSNALEAASDISLALTRIGYAGKTSHKIILPLLARHAEACEGGSNEGRAGVRSRMKQTEKREVTHQPHASRRRKRIDSPNGRDSGFG